MAETHNAVTVRFARVAEPGQNFRHFAGPAPGQGHQAGAGVSAQHKRSLGRQRPGH